MCALVTGVQTCALPIYAGRRLEVEATGIEADALADQGQSGMFRVAPDEVDQARQAVRGAADRMHHRVILFQQFVADDAVELGATDQRRGAGGRSEEHTSELQSLMRISYAVFCLNKQKTTHTQSI